SFSPKSDNGRDSSCVQSPDRFPPMPFAPPFPNPDLHNGWNCSAESFLHRFSASTSSHKISRPYLPPHRVQNKSSGTAGPKGAVSSFPDRTPLLPPPFDGAPGCSWPWPGCGKGKAGPGGNQSSDQSTPVHPDPILRNRH